MEMKENLLCIVPPYSTDSPPLGIASLLGYFGSRSSAEFGFVDLRLFAQKLYSPTYRVIGKNKESYVVDIPDLPVVLSILKHFGRPGRGFQELLSEEVIIEYCHSRQIDHASMCRYLGELYDFFDHVAVLFRHVRFIGFSIWSSNYFSTLLFASILKRQNPEIFVLAGGPQVTESRNAAKLGLASGAFDMVAMGEGEQQLVDVFEAYSSGGTKGFEDIPNVMFSRKEDGSFAVNDQKATLRMDELPFPVFDQMMVSAYQTRQGVTSLPMQLTRGCTDKCSFCSEWVFWQRYRQLGPSRAMEHVKYLVERYGANHIRFMDSLLNGNKKRLRMFMENLLSSGLKIAWSGFMRADMEDAFAHDLRRAGFTHAFIGVESMNDNTLDAMKKRRNYNDNYYSLVNFLKHGIGVNAGIIAGFPTDPPGSFEETLSTLLELKSQYKHLSISVEPFILSPNQPMYKNIDDYGLKTRGFGEDVLNIAEEFRFITEQIPETVSGPNQELRGKLTAFSNQKVPGAFQWSDNSHLGSGHTINEISNGCYLLKLYNYAEISDVYILTEAEKQKVETSPAELERIVSTIREQHICYYCSRKVKLRATVARVTGPVITIGSFLNMRFIELGIEFEPQVRELFRGNSSQPQGKSSQPEGNYNETLSHIEAELKSRELIQETF